MPGSYYWLVKWVRCLRYSYGGAGARRKRLYCLRDLPDSLPGLCDKNRKDKNIREFVKLSVFIPWQALLAYGILFKVAVGEDNFHSRRFLPEGPKRVQKLPVKKMLTKEIKAVKLVKRARERAKKGSWQTQKSLLSYSSWSLRTEQKKPDVKQEARGWRQEARL